MKLLVDTHAVIWFLAGVSHLSPPARAAIEDPANTVLVSSVTGYELAYKQRRGLIAFPFIDALPSFLKRARIAVLPVTMDHALAAARLPGPHRDPWDRIIYAQAEIERCTIVTRHPMFADYGARTLW